MKRKIAFLLAIVMCMGILANFTFAKSTPTVTVVNYRTQLGEDSENLRCSSLLEVKTSGFKEGAKLTYKYSTTLKVSCDEELAIYSTPNMYLATDDCCYEQYQNYNGCKTYTSQWKYFTVCGRKCGDKAVTDCELKGKIVKVTVSDGTNTVTWTNSKDFKQANLAKDMENLVLGIFEGDTTSIAKVLAISGITHISCSNCYVTADKSNNTNIVSVNGSTIKGVKKGEAQVGITVKKSCNCIMHTGSKNTSTIKVRVFPKPVATPTNNSITLTNLEAGIKYTINGVTKEATENTKELVFDGLKSGTKYPIVASVNYEGQEVRAELCCSTTCYVMIHFMIDDKPVNPSAIYGKGVEIYDKGALSCLNAYYKSVVIDDANGVYALQKKGCNSERTFYAKVGCKYIPLHTSPLSRCCPGDYYERYYTLSYKAPDGVTGINLPATELVYKGTEVTIKAASGEGIVINGWVDQEGNTYVPGQKIKLTKQLILTAVVAHNYTVSYYGPDKNNDNDLDKEAIVMPEGTKIILKLNGGKYEGKDSVDPITLSKDTEIKNPTKENNIFAGWIKEEKGNTITLTAQWDEDKVGEKDKDGKDIPDGIPDKYQVKVTFNPNGGTWNDGSKDTKHVYVTLFDGEKYSTTGSGKLEVKDGLTKVYFVFGGWSDGNGNYIKAGSTITIKAPTNFMAEYDADKVGGKDNYDNDIPDGIADKYQVKETFDPNGGAWENGSTDAKHVYVTLFDGDEYSENGSGKVQLPVAAKATGKMFNGWENSNGDVFEAEAIVDVTDESVFTATYQEITYCPRDTTCPIEKFTDTLNDYWWHDGIHYCTEKKYMIGTEETLFDPEGYTSRGMLVAILWRIEGSPVVDGEMTFTDVPSWRYYYQAIKWAVKNDIVNGYSDITFAPETFVTREEMATILYRYAKYNKVSVANDNSLTHFADFKTISRYAVDALTWANATNLIKGFSEDLIVPKNYTSRAQCAEMIWRYCNFVRTQG